MTRQERFGWWTRCGQTLKYYYLKIMRNSGSPDYIARGVAIGLFIGFFIPMFFQLMVAIPLAFLLKAAKFPAAALTFVSNHFTVIVLYPLQCYVGSYLIFRPFRYDELTEMLKGLIANPCWDSFRQLGAELALSFFAGGLLFGLLFAVPGYFLTIRLVNKYREKRARKRAAKL